MFYRDTFLFYASYVCFLLRQTPAFHVSKALKPIFGAKTPL